MLSRAVVRTDWRLCRPVKRWADCLLPFTLVLLFTTTCVAETKDRVVVRQPNGSRIGVSGTIVEYTGNEIQIRLNANSQPRTYNVADVTEVVYGRTRSHLNGMDALEAHHFSEALRLLGRSLEEEERRWVRREILSQQVQCEKQLGHFGSAATKFLTIMESDPETHYYKQIPLIWASQEVTEEEKTRARQWIESTMATARLIGASFLLDDPNHGETANQLLKKLATHPDARIFGLAHPQSWRRKIVAGKVTAQDLVSWTRRLDRIPEDLRAGPCYLLGRAHMGRNQYDRAARLFLWLPIVYDEDRQLAARSCLEAGHALAMAGRKEQAATLYREVVTRFAETPFAAEAGDALPPAASKP